MRARRRGWAAVLVAGATGMSGVGSVLWFTALPAAAFTAPVKVLDRAFDPQTTRIEVGDKVLWRNLTDERHSVTSDSGDTEFDYTLGRKNAQEERRFETAGTYTYHCKFHPGMTGTVEVVDPDAAPTTTSSTAPPPPPPTTATTAPPPPSTTATTAAPPPTTTTTAGRPPAAVPLPPVPNSAAAPPPRATSSTTTMPPSTTTTVPPTTATSAPPPVTAEAAPPTSAPPSPPSTEAAPSPDRGDEVPTAAGPVSSAGDGPLDPATVTLISLLVAVGLFGAWTLIRIRPGRI